MFGKNERILRVKHLKSREHFELVLSALDLIDFGIFIIGPDGTVVTINTEGQRILDLKDGISLDDSSQLKVNDPINDHQLNQAIRSTTNTSPCTGHHKNHLILVKRKHKLDSLLIELCPLNHQRAELSEDSRGAIVLVLDPNKIRTVSAAGLAHLYHLTPAESEVCRLLVQGDSIKEIAKTRNVRIMTVRSQIKVLFNKTGTHHRVQLVRLATNIKPSY